LSIIIIIII